MEETPASYPPPLDPPGAPPPGAPPAAVIPWEDQSRPWTSALVETVRILLSDPRRAFERVPLEGDVLKPVIFALLFGVLGVVSSGAWSLFGNLFPTMSPPPRELEELKAILLKLQVAQMLFSPLIVAFFLLVTSAMIHLSLMLLGQARHGFRTTLRAQSYSYAPQLVCVLPFCGSFVGGVWCLVLAVIGISTMHSTSISNAVLAVLLPGVMVCCCFGAVIVGIQMMSGMMGGMP